MLGDYMVVGTLLPEEQAHADAHLDHCGNCATYYIEVAPTVPLACQELVELVTAYLDGALPPAERERFERHIRYCRGCRRYLAQMRETIRQTGHLTEENIDPAARARLLDAFRNWKRGVE